MSKLDGIVKASSPAWMNRMTSPPKTQDIFLRRLKPVPNGATDQWVTWKDAFTIALSSSFVACYLSKFWKSLLSKLIQPFIIKYFHNSHKQWQRNYQITFGCDRYQNRVISDPDLFSFRSLFWGWMNCPPAWFAYRDHIYIFTWRNISGVYYMHYTLFLRKNCDLKINY